MKEEERPASNRYWGKGAKLVGAPLLNKGASNGGALPVDVAPFLIQPAPPSLAPFYGPRVPG
jgi:hypothetical protein